MKDKLVKNFFYQSIYQITLLILPIITIPIVSHSLGAKGLGVYNYVTSIVAYFILFAGLGLANYGIREIAIVKDNKKKLSKKFWELELFNIIVAMIIIVLYLIFLLFVNQKLYFLISGVSLLATLFDISWFYYGTEDFKSITSINLVIKILSFTLIYFLIKDYGDLWLYFFIQSFSILFSNISLWFFMRNKVVWIKPKIGKALCHLKPALKYFVGKISVTLYTNMNKTMLGLMVSSVAVGIYSSSIQLITIFVTLVGTLDTVLMPHMTKLFSTNSHDKMISTLEKTIDLQFFLTIPLMFGIILVSPKMIPWFFGPDFSMLNIIVPILSPLVIIMPLGISIVRQYLIPQNKIREFNVSVIIAAIVSIVLNLIFLPIVGIYGAILATFLSEIIVTVVRLYDLKKHTVFKFSLDKIVKYFISAIIMYFIVKGITISFSETIFTTIVQGVLGIVFYGFFTIVLRVNILFKIKS